MDREQAKWLVENYETVERGLLTCRLDCKAYFLRENRDVIAAFASGQRVLVHGVDQDDIAFDVSRCFYKIVPDWTPPAGIRPGWVATDIGCDSPCCWFGNRPTLGPDGIYVRARDGGAYFMLGRPSTGYIFDNFTPPAPGQCHEVKGSE